GRRVERAIAGRALAQAAARGKSAGRWRRESGKARTQGGCGCLAGAECAGLRRFGWRGRAGICRLAGVAPGKWQGARSGRLLGARRAKGEAMAGGEMTAGI
ncbi:MAG: hypothetical protein LBJ10_04370, partial [Clostridiales bacterium]|nr:hypothetical protein [Clostridiales bacterium]